MRPILITLIIFFYFSLSLSQSELEPLPGHLVMTIPSGVVNLPRAVYGLYVSFNGGVTIDSVQYLTFREGRSGTIMSDEKISYQCLSQNRPDLLDKISVNFDSKILNLLKKYKVRVVMRLSKGWSPQDTIPRMIQPRRVKEPFLWKAKNMNRRIWIKFDKSFDVYEVANEFKKIEGITDVEFNYPIIEFKNQNNIASSLDRNSYEKGELLLFLNTDLFNFPLEVYGAYFSYQNNTVSVDSFVLQHFKPDTRVRVKEEIISEQSLLQHYPGIRDNIKFTFPAELVNLFKKYEVYYVARLAHCFSPSDTIPHYINTIKGRKLHKSENDNLNLVIKFNEKFEPLKVAEELNKLEFVKAAEPNAKIIMF